MVPDGALLLRLEEKRRRRRSFLLVLALCNSVVFHTLPDRGEELRFTYQTSGFGKRPSEKGSKRRNKKRSGGGDVRLCRCSFKQRSARIDGYILPRGTEPPHVECSLLSFPSSSSSTLVLPPLLSLQQDRCTMASVASAAPTETPDDLPTLPLPPLSSLNLTSPPGPPPPQLDATSWSHLRTLLKQALESTKVLRETWEVRTLP